MRQLSELIGDWGGFEQLVADLNKTGDVVVERDVVLTGKSGAPRQIDVLLRHKRGLYEHIVVAECKYWNRAVERSDLDAFIATIRDVGADRGVMFSTHGFQSGAVTVAEHEGVYLFKVREPTPEEWGLPGRHIDIWLHVIGLSLGSPQMHDPFVLDPAKAPKRGLNLAFGPGVDTTTPMLSIAHTERTLEALLARLTRDSAKKSYRAERVAFGDGVFDGTMSWLINVIFSPKQPIQVTVDDCPVFVPKITFDVGVRIEQSRIQHDRAQGFIFVLAVEDCVRKSVTAASKRADTGETVLASLSREPPANPDDILQNGILLQVWMKGFLAFDEFRGMEPGKIRFQEKR